MPPKPYLIADYEAWFDAEEIKLSLEPGSSVIGPDTDPCGTPGQAPWQLNWAIIFPKDNMHIRIKENYAKMKSKYGAAGYRQNLAFHYGLCGDEFDSNGYPERDRKSVV